MSEKRYYVNCALYLCDNDLSNTLSIFECADLLNELTEENEQLRNFIKKEKEYHERIMNYQKEIKGLKNIIFNLKNEIHNLKNDNDYYTDKRRFDLYD